jgi:hypothetical protein
MEDMVGERPTSGRQEVIAAAERREGGRMVRAVASAFGIAFLAVGVLGFILNPTGGELLGIFAVNVVHNLVHVAFGVLGIAASFTKWSRTYLQIVGAIYLLLGILGFVPGLYFGHEMLLGLVHINLADNLLHLALGGAAAYFGFVSQPLGRASSTA